MRTKQERENDLGFWMGKVCRLHHAHIHNTLEGMGVYRGQPPLLFFLIENDGSTHRELAEFLHVTPATVSNMVKRMEKNGLVKRQSDPHDERISRVFITDQGRRSSEDIEQVFAQIEKEIVKGFTVEEAQQLKTFFLRIYENLLPKNELKQ